MWTCADCGEEFDLDEGGFIWEGMTFCQWCDPEACDCDKCNNE